MRFPLLRRSGRATKAVRNCRTEAALRIGGGDDSRGGYCTADQCGLKLMQSLEEVSGGGDRVKRLR
jgi:hypothetical protein